MKNIEYLQINTGKATSLMANNQKKKKQNQQKRPDLKDKYILSYLLKFYHSIFITATAKM